MPFYIKDSSIQGFWCRGGCSRDNPPRIVRDNNSMLNKQLRIMGKGSSFIISAKRRFKLIGDFKFGLLKQMIGIFEKKFLFNM